MKFWAGQTISVFGSAITGLALPLTAVITLNATPAKMGFSNVIYNINQVSLRQVIIPNRLLGRMNASMRFLVWGTIPLGAFLASALGSTIGMTNTLLIGLIGGSTAFLWVLFSPVRSLKEHRKSPKKTSAAINKNTPTLKSSSRSLTARTCKPFWPPAPPRCDPHRWG